MLYLSNAPLSMVKDMFLSLFLTLHVNSSTALKPGVPN